jgi:hypothetical protein
MWTQPQHHVHSSVKKNRRNPKWKNQVLEVLVQEPDSQVLRVVMHDIDILNPKVSHTTCSRYTATLPSSWSGTVSDSQHAWVRARESCSF